MPNHVTTTMTIRGIGLGAFKATHLVPDEEGQLNLDCNTVIPMPLILRGSTSGSAEHFGLIALTQQEPERRIGSVLDWAWVKKEGITTLAQFSEWVHRTHPEWIEAGRRTQQCVEETGYSDWYEWACANWGTKWGIYETRIVCDERYELTLRFCSAWSTPAPVFEALAARWPTLTFETWSYDEGGGFAAHGEWILGIGAEETMEATPEAFERAYGYPQEDDDGA